MKIKLILLSPLVVLIMGIIFFNKLYPQIPRDETFVRTPASPIRRQQQTEKPEAVKLESQNNKINPNISSFELENFRDSLPSLELIKEEVQKDPHSTPNSLITFAKKLGPLMEKALKNLTNAEMLADELQDCAMDESIIHSARATCVANMERLAERHQIFEERAEQIKKNVSSDVRTLLNNKDRQLR